ncbi:MAG: tetratricopeptide repeat protein [Planctomycetes bacterium]|nr:tetratricopeptide repeat protein [Planctomycetota bacterium]
MLARSPVPLALVVALLPMQARSQEPPAPDAKELEVLQQAEQRLRAKDLPGAIRVLDTALAAAPERWRLWHLRAYCKGRSGDLDGGIGDASKAIELAPSEAMAFVERGFLYTQKGAHAEALADLNRAVGLAPTNATAFGDRGDLKKAMGDPLGARADYDRAIELQPDFGAAFHNRALASFALGSYAAAVADQRQAIRLTKPMADMWEVLARSQLVLGQLDAAVTSVTRGLTIDGERDDLREFRAEINLRRGRLGPAIEDLEAVVARAQARGEDPRRLAMWHQEHGCYLLLAEKHAEAEQALRRAGAAMDSLRPWSELMLWCARPRGPEAEAALRAAFAEAEAAPDSPGQILLSICLGEAPPERIAGEESSVRCTAWFLAGWRAHRDGDAATAERCFRRAIATGRIDVFQWRMAVVRGGFVGTPAPRGTLGCTVRAVDGATPPRLEVLSLEEFGPAAQQGLALGARIAMVNDQPATPAAFSAMQESLVLGQPVRLLIVAGETTAPHWVLAGAANR